MSVAWAIQTRSVQPVRLGGGGGGGDGELPQVSFLLQQNFCHGKQAFVVTNTCLS